MDILIGTNHLANFSGSEMVCLEMAAYFRAQGHRVTVFANVAGDPVARAFRHELRIEIVTDPARVRPPAFDLVYLQHHVAGLFDYATGPDTRARTAFVFGKLGRRSFMQSGGWRHERVLADGYFANSELTGEALAALDLGAPVHVFHNAAPAAFFRPAVTATRLRTILVVTNHDDPALMGAIDRLSATHRVRHIGASGGAHQRVTPDMIRASDLVISIGKTVPYALAARVPVYVYDHFGGPGYLTPANFARAARFNFTGRCCERLLDAQALAREIVGQYAAGLAFAAGSGPAELERYRLEPHLDALLATEASDNAARAARMAASGPDLQAERLMATYVREQSRDAQFLLRRPLRVLRRRLVAEAALAARRGRRTAGGLIGRLRGD
ncbi:glycosyltransferase family 4 protein [Starkeya koreensis]|uniref:Glycosyltransferase family 4 protein n=1 Tax=Ancylobacter koreensis TaxID=266121 RepID=A0ABT0DNF1_9HYPH|nr:glycosyltransferase family 4 protein [Ancylobacter koreensis]MCK0208729.1 glycosyltransferase family 4 protein [Ancylobacter koreensis]